MRFGDSEVSFGTSGVRISQLQKKTRNGVQAIFGLTLPAASTNPNAVTQPVEPSDANTCEREAHLRVLADQLLFVVEKNGELFTLKRTADVSEPVCKQDLNLAQAEELLRTWKLRGFHGG